jgi:SAM-dependent methyltransferase
MAYGKEFAKVYDEKWNVWGARMWPFVFKLAKEYNPDATSWLDLCCGTGALIKYVTERGFSGTGIDISPYQIKVANSKVPAAEFLVEDVRNFSLPRKFDVITCTYDSFNYLTEEQDLEKALQKAASHLAEDGAFIFDMNTYQGLRDKWCEKNVFRDPSMSIIIDASFNPKTALGKCIITGFIKDGSGHKKFEETHIERGYYSTEIEKLLNKAGLSFKKYDGDTFKKPKSRAGRIIYACQMDR